MFLLRRWRVYTLLFVLMAVSILTGCDCGPSDLGANSELISAPRTLTFNAQAGIKQTKKVVLRVKTGSVELDTIKLTKGAPHYVIDPASLPTFPKTLAEGESLTLTVHFTAPVGGSVIGEITVESDAAIPTDGILTIKMFSKLNQQDLHFTPNPANFGEVVKGKKKTLKIIGENRGRAELKIQGVKWNGKPDIFKFVGGLPKAQTLKPGDKFEFTVEYSPTTAKQDKGILEFTCEGNCSPGNGEKNLRKDPFPLRFFGNLAAANIEVTPLKLDFGFVASGSKNTKNVRISNKGSAPLIIEKISMEKKSSGAFIVPRLINVSIAPGQSKELPVSFSPTVGSEHKGVIIIKHNDPNKSDVLVRLFGKVSAPNIEVQPRLLDYGKAPIAKTKSFTIANSGDRPLTIKSIVKIVGTSPEFAIDLSKIKFPWVLPPNKFQAISVVYTPADQGDDVGQIQITSDDPDEPKVKVELKATGSAIPACDLAPTPSRVNFGLSVIGKSKTIPVKWFNQGGRDCQITQFDLTTDRGFPPYMGPDVYHLSNPPQGCTGKDGRFTCNPPLIVKPGNSITTKISFFPLSEKQTTPLTPPNFTGAMDVKTNGNPPVRRVVLDGLATKSCVQVVPDNIDFGLVTINCSSRNEKIRIYNTCKDSITVNKIGFSSGASNGFRIVKAQVTPFTVPSGQDAEIELAYRATAPARKQNAVFEIEHTLKQQSPLSVPLIAEGTTTSEQTDTFNQLKSPKIDILFVIDNSCSMGDEQQSMATNFASFIQWASNLKVDFQIGVTTTDTGGSPIGGSVTPGELVGPKGDKILTAATPNLQAAFTQRVRVGTNGGGTEAGLEGAKQALSHPLITTGVNKGFLRKDASLSIIAVSDEPDQSPQPAQFYINFFKNIKGFKFPNMFRFNAVIGYDEKTKKNQCGGSGGNAGARSNGRYLAVVQSSRGIVSSICNSNWANTLSRIGAVTFGLKKQFLLSRPADPKTIQVKVDGAVVAKGATTWDFSTQDNSIVFIKSPTAGAAIQVTYKAICF